MNADDKPNVRLLRENAALRKVAIAAAKVRRLGLATEKVEAAMAEHHAANPHASRSATAAVILERGYEEALRQFDDAMLECADLMAQEPDIHTALTAALPGPRVVQPSSNT